MLGEGHANVDPAGLANCAILSLRLGQPVAKSFPETRPTLIARLARGTGHADWEQFLGDYWGPIVRFAARAGRMPVDQAEDVASETLLTLLRSNLLSRWQSSPSGKLRSFICGVTRNLLANRRRVEEGRRELLKDAAAAGGIPGALAVSDSPEPTVSDDDAFYRAWVDELLARSMRQIRSELYAEDRGDYFRALYGRVCEGLSAGEIGEALGVPTTTVENYLRIARTRLGRALEQAVRQHVERYSPAADMAGEFEREWTQLREHLEKFGGLEASLQREAASHDALPAGAPPSPSFCAVRNQLRGASHPRSADIGDS